MAAVYKIAVGDVVGPIDLTGSEAGVRIEVKCGAVVESDFIVISDGIIQVPTSPPTVLTRCNATSKIMECTYAECYARVGVVDEPTIA